MNYTYSFFKINCFHIVWIFDTDFMKIVSFVYYIIIIIITIVRLLIFRIIKTNCIQFYIINLYLIINKYLPI